MTSPAAAVEAHREPATAPVEDYFACGFCAELGVTPDNICPACGGQGFQVRYLCSGRVESRNCGIELRPVGRIVPVDGGRASDSKRGYACPIGHRWWHIHRTIEDRRPDGTYFRDRWSWEQVEDVRLGGQS